MKVIKSLQQVLRMCMGTLLLLFWAPDVSALTATVDGVTYAYKLADGEVTLDSGVSGRAAIDKYIEGVLRIPASIDGYPVTGIGDYGFYECTKLTQVTIPDSVRTISDNAFGGCLALQTVTIGRNVTAIGNGAFYQCGALTRVVIPDSVLTIDIDAFAQCGSLASVTLGNSVTSIGSWAFNGCRALTAVTIPNSVTELASWAFQDCSSLATVKLGNRIETINQGTFYQCGVESIIIPDNVTTLKKKAFELCTALTSVTLGRGVTNISEEVFSSCSSLTSVKFNSDITDIEYAAFYECSSLAGIAIPGSVKTIGKYAFYGCTKLVAFTIGENVTSIGDYAFTRTKLSSVIIPDSVTEVGREAFAYCDQLASVVIGNSVATIGSGAFSSCPRLISATIGSGVSSMGDNAFLNCQALITVRCLGSAPQLGGNAVYQGTPEDLVTEVMKGSRGWNGNAGSAELPSVWPITGAYQRGISFFLSTVTFNANGGTLSNAKLSLEAGDTYDELPTPTRSGYVFAGWFTAAVNGEPITIDSTVPAVNTTLYAQWSKGYTVTVKGGTATATTGVAGAKLTLTANAAPDGQEFQKWTKAPATVAFADGFGETDFTTQIIIPAANVMMTAVYIKAPGSLGVTLVPNNGQTVTGVEWSTDKKAWYAADEIKRLPSGAYTLSFRSLDGQWLVPASIKVTLGAGSADAPTLVAVECEFAPAFDGTALAGTTDPNNNQGYWDDEAGQLDWTGLRVGLRAKLGPLPLQANATSVKLKSGKLPAGLKLLTIDGQVYLSGIPTKAGTYPAVLQAMEGKKAGALLPVVWTVQDLPTEYIGTFNGVYTATTNDITRHSTLTLTVAKTGKLTGSVSLGGKKYSLKADAFDAIDYDREAMSVTNAAFICTNPKLTNAVNLTISLSEAGLGLFEVTPIPTATGDYTGQAVRNGWKDKVKHALRVTAVNTVNGYYTLSLYPEDDSYGAGYVTLTVDAKGGVKAAGKLADGTSASGSGVLLVTDEDISTVIALSPSAYKGGELYLNVKFLQDAQPRVETVEPVNWVNTVTTTTSNGPFERKPSVKGGWYSKTETLYTLYGVGTPYSLGLEAEVITNAVSVNFNTKGTGVDALSKTNNPYNVKLTLTPKTGLFSGSFNETGVKTAYKLYGILTPYLVTDTDDTAGLGFYSIPVVVPKTQRSELFRLTTEAVEAP